MSLHFKSDSGVKVCVIGAFRVKLKVPEAAMRLVWLKTPGGPTTSQETMTHKCQVSLSLKCCHFWWLYHFWLQTGNTGHLRKISLCLVLSSTNEIYRENPEYSAFYSVSRTSKCKHETFFIRNNMFYLFLLHHGSNVYRRQLPATARKTFTSKVTGFCVQRLGKGVAEVSLGHATCLSGGRRDLLCNM